MYIPYCGWNKDLNDDMTAASDFDFLPLDVKEEINRRANQIEPPDDVAEHKSNESN